MLNCVWLCQVLVFSYRSPDCTVYLTRDAVIAASVAELWTISIGKATKVICLISVVSEKQASISVDAQLMALSCSGKRLKVFKACSQTLPFYIASHFSILVRKIFVRNVGQDVTVDTLLPAHGTGQLTEGEWPTWSFFTLMLARY